jgi:transposase-like protein
MKTVVCPRCKQSDKIDKAIHYYAVFQNGDSQHMCDRCGTGFLLKKQLTFAFVTSCQWVRQF